MRLSLSPLFIFLFAFCPVVGGQENVSSQDPFQHPFANPVDNPKVPRVLLIGDSISINYTPRVRRLLDGKANVHRPGTNCRWSAFGDEKIEEWVGQAEWDVIHFNFGLWDWYGWSQEVKATPKSYADNLDNIVRKLKKTNATLIFGMTTPPCIGSESSSKIVVREDRAKQFNDAARAVMKSHGVPVNNLYAVIGEDREKYQRGENDVHYNEAGRDLLAARVAQAVDEVLPNKGAKPEALTGPSSIPNALILGDSISIAYTPLVVKKLKGKVNVSRPKANCGNTQRYLKSLPHWLGDQKWDVIHFNVGLHDLCYRHPDSKVQGNRDKKNGAIAVPLVEYEKNLEQIVETLKTTGAQLVWASTTMIPDGEAGRIVGDDVKYNAVARKIMEKHGVQINDLHALSATFPSSLFRKPGDVHFQPGGSKKLADQVVVAIQGVLKKTESK